MNIEQAARRRLPGHFVFIFCLFAIVLAVTAVYVSSERAFYWSDYSGYEEIAHRILASSRASATGALLDVIRSMGDDYNALFTLPVVPLMQLVGESRLDFELILAAIYLAPFALALGAVATQLLPGHSSVVFWSTVAIALLTPFFWVSTLRGYPDVGAATLIAFATWIYLRDIHLKRIRQIVLIGVLLGTAIVFRRHFAYACVAYLAAMGTLALFTALQKWRFGQRGWLEVLNDLVRVALVALISVLVVAVLGRSLLIRMVTVDFNALYSSYLEPAGAVVKWFTSAYGWIVVLAALAGFVLGWRSLAVSRPSVQFLTFFCVFLCALWLVIVRELGEHYTLHFTPFIVWGLVMLARITLPKLRGASRGIVIAGAACFMVVNFIIGLAPRQFISNETLGTLFAMGSPPLMREDYEDVGQLVDYLRDHVNPDDDIYVAAFSSVINRGILTNAERQLHGWEDARLRILRTPNVDSRDFWPLEMLVDSEIVIVADPFQHDLAPEEQDIVRAAGDLFRKHHPFSNDFVRLPATFTLKNGVTTSIYKRIRPTSPETAVKALHEMQFYEPKRPGSQPDWIMIGHAGNVSIRQNLNNLTEVIAQSIKPVEEVSATLLYLGPRHGPAEGTVLASASSEGCKGWQLRESMANTEGHMTPDAKPMAVSSSPTSIDTPPASQGYLLLQLAQDGAHDAATECTLELRR